MHCSTSQTRQPRGAETAGLENARLECKSWKIQDSAWCVKGGSQVTDSQSDRQKVDQIYFTVKICRTPDLHKLVFSAHRLTPVLLSLLDIFIHHRGGRNKQKKTVITITTIWKKEVT